MASTVSLGQLPLFPGVFVNGCEAKQIFFGYTMNHVSNTVTKVSSKSFKDTSSQTTVEIKNVNKPSNSKGRPKKPKKGNSREQISACIQYISKENEILRRNKSELARNLIEKRREVAHLQSLIVNSSSIRSILNNIGVRKIDDDCVILDETDDTKAKFASEVVGTTSNVESFNLNPVKANIISPERQFGVCMHVTGKWVTLMTPCRECGKVGAQDCSGDVQACTDDVQTCTGDVKACTGDAQASKNDLQASVDDEMPVWVDIS